MHDLPREKLRRLGPKQLSTAELVALVLGTGTPGKTVFSLSADLTTAYSLTALSDMRVMQLSSSTGFAKACRLIAAFELGKRIHAEQVLDKNKLSSAEDIYLLLRPHLHPKKEQFMALFLDTRLNLLKIELISIGTLTSALVHPRELFKAAIQESTAHIILAHNHPAGDPTPSTEDINITKRLIKVAELIGIPILDHVIMGNDNQYSMREHYFHFFK